jgi:hypothetical protein
VDPVMHSRVNTCTGIESSYQVLHGPCLHLIMGSVGSVENISLTLPFPLSLSLLIALYATLSSDTYFHVLCIFSQV